MKFALFPAAVLVAAGIFAGASPSFAASHTSVFQGHGYTLNLVAGHSKYGLTQTGSLRVKGKVYQLRGDWIPAGDAGGELLRFFGTAFGHVKGLVGVATLYDTCIPNCAASRHYQLSAMIGFSIPGPAGKGKVILTLKP
ncbi:MAG: hypothetical protein ACRDFS_05290 [Chloroflexota bacterium]